MSVVDRELVSATVLSAMIEQLSDHRIRVLYRITGTRKGIQRRPSLDWVWKHAYGLPGEIRRKPFLEADA